MRSITVLAALAGLVAASPMPRNVTSHTGSSTRSHSGTSTTRSHSVNLNVPTGSSTKSHSVNLNVPSEKAVKIAATSGGARNATATHAHQTSSAPAEVTIPSWSSPADTPTWMAVAEPSWTSVDTPTQEPTWTRISKSGAPAYTQKPASNATSFHHVGPDTPIATATSFDTPTLSPVETYKPASGTRVKPFKPSSFGRNDTATATYVQEPSFTPSDLPEPTVTPALSPVKPFKPSSSGRNDTATATYVQAPSFTPADLPEPTVTPALSPVKPFKPFKPSSFGRNDTATATYVQEPSFTPADLPVPTVTVTATVIPENPTDVSGWPTEISSSLSKPTGTKTRTPTPSAMSTSVRVAVGHANGTFTDSVEVLIDVVNKLDGPTSVSFLYLAPPSDDKTYLQVDCFFSSPSNATLGSVSAAKPTTIPVVPAAAVGFISCSFSD